MPKAKLAFPEPRYRSVWDTVVMTTGKLESLGALLCAANKNDFHGSLQGIGQILEEIAEDLKATYDRIDQMENRE